MALDKLSQKILTSLHGRKLGLDIFGYQVGTPGVRHAIDLVTAASTIARSGVTILNSTAAINHTLAAPEAVGVEKTIINNSTFALTVSRSTALGACSFGYSTGTDPAGQKITFALKGSAVTLVAVSTSVWMPKNSPASTGWISLATST